MYFFHICNEKLSPTQSYISISIACKVLFFLNRTWMWRLTSTEVMIFIYFFQLALSDFTCCLKLAPNWILFWFKAEADLQEQYFEPLVKKEQLEEKMRGIREQKCRAVTCKTVSFLTKGLVFLHKQNNLAHWLFFFVNICPCSCNGVILSHNNELLWSYWSPFTLLCLHFFYFA